MVLTLGCRSVLLAAEYDCEDDAGEIVELKTSTERSVTAYVPLLPFLHWRETDVFCELRQAVEVTFYVGAECAGRCASHRRRTADR